MRANRTEAEAKLWEQLRRKRIGGLRFRRQFSIGPYFGDFVCLTARLVVEVDGGQHAEAAQTAHDERRTAWLAKRNFRVLRLWNEDVLRDPNGAIYAIECIVREQIERKPLPQASAAALRMLAPSRKGRGK